MKSGRELDALIAEKVMGLEVVRNKRGGWSVGTPDYYDDAGMSVLSNPLPDYSTDIAAAWEVVEKMRSLGCFIKVHNCDHRGTWGCWCTHPESSMSESFAVQDTAPHAICLAALKAVGYETT